MGGGEGTAELVQVHGLIVVACIPEGKFAARDHGLDVVVFGQLHTGAVHPGLIFGHQGQALPFILHQAAEDRVLKNNIGLQQQSVLRHQILTGQSQGIDVVGLVVYGIIDEADGSFHVQSGDVVPQLLSLISGHNDDPGQIQAVQLTKGPVDEGNAAHLYHTFGIVAGELL